MAKTSNDNSAQDTAGCEAVIFVHASGTAAIGNGWIERILALGHPVYSRLALPGCRQTGHGYAQLGMLLAELSATAPGRPVFLIRHGMAPRQRQFESLLRAMAAAKSPLAHTVLSNAWPALNPFAGLAAESGPAHGRCRRAIEMFGSGRLLAHVHWPGHFIALSPGAVSVLAHASVTPGNALPRLHENEGRLELADWIYVDAPDEPLFAAANLEAHESMRPPAWGELSARLQAWLEAGAPELAPVGTGGRPVTLHISHSWGGGVSQWVRTFIEHDSSSDHLQLLSEGPQSDQGPGQRMSLYAGNVLDCPVASWWMQPPIQSVADHSEQYENILRCVLLRHGVGRLIVSSLVGHSLDALRGGLPVVQVLHDYFPVWPLLSIHPEQFSAADGSIDVTAALETVRRGQEFPDRGANSWRAVRAAYLETLRAHDVTVTAPSQSVAKLQKRLDKGWKHIDIHVIPHGFPPLESDGPVPARPRADHRLRMVVMGRIQHGKGQKLLLDALPELTRYAHVSLLGTGKSGEAFFGIPGVDVLIQYARAELPGILHDIGPHFAALLSVVPETFSYTLSELQHLGIPAIATRTGSFNERIRDGIDGWLIEPAARALIDQVAALFEAPESIAGARRALAGAARNDPAEMVHAYNRLCPPEAAAPSAREQGMNLLQAQAAAASHRAIMERVSHERTAQARAGLEREVEKRTEWALDTRKALEKERRVREQAEAHLDEAEAHLNKARADFETARAELDTAITERNAIELSRQQTAAELEETGIVLVETRAALQDTLKNLNDTRGDLAAIRKQQAEILASTSWRITRPFRALRRAAGQFVRGRAWNPLRWPVLFARLAHNLATVGLRGTLMRMQYSGQENLDMRTEEQTPEVEIRQAPAAVPLSSRPLASIVIPVYNNWSYTAACLRSIGETVGATPCELILVDDASTDATAEHAGAVRGLRYLRNERNLGFIGSCNRGAAEARGEYIVLLNNDTEVLEGWLDALLDTFEKQPGAGLVGARLVYPDGSLQECGGLLFQDGSGWNYGRGDDPDKPEYQYLRETDYCSGACLAIRTDVFRKLGGFDTRYAPAYYEDTDLAFRVRESGLKVFVQPRATVIHHEGITSGTDLSTGIKRYQVTNREKFLERWGDALQGHAAPIEDPANLALVRGARDHSLQGRVLIIDATTPEPDQDSGSVRITKLMGCFRDLGFGVTFFADNRAFAGHYSRDLQDAGVEVIYTPWLDSLSGFFRERGGEFDYVLISRHYIAANYVALIRRHCPQAKFIFDTVDLHYLREQRLAELEHSRVLEQAARQTRKAELSVIASADAVLVVSPAEVDVLATDAPDALVHVVSNIHDVHGCRAGFSERRDLLFIGGYQHPPNVDAMLWFVNDIWPLIRAELPGVNFHMIGSKAPEKIRALRGEGVVFHGFVKDIGPHLDQCRLAVAPLRYGAGVKGKVNMSMSHGQPVVATPMAVEGMHAEHGREILVADTEQSFAQEVIQLYSDEALWERVSRAALENVEAHFSVAAARRSLRELIGKLE